MDTNLTEGFRLSPAQQRVWALRQNGDIAFFQAQVEIRGDLKVPELARAMETVARNHEILRATFSENTSGAGGAQFIREFSPAALKLVELDGSSEAEQSSSLMRIAAEDARKCQLNGHWIVSLARLDLRRHRLLLTLPALCADYHTIDALLRQMAAVYENAENGSREADFIQYISLSESVSELIESPETAAGRRYWDDQDWVSLLAQNLPIERRLARQPAFTPQSHSFLLDREVAEAFGRLSQSAGVTLDACLLGCWQILLGSLLDGSRFVVGVAFDGRSQNELRQVLGPLEQVLPVTCSPDPTLSFKQFARRLEEILYEHQSWQDFFSWPRLERETSREISFPFLFEFRPQATLLEAAGLVWELLSNEGCVDRYRLRCRCRPGNVGIQVEFHYDAALIDSDEIPILADRFVNLARAVAKEPEILLGKISFSGDSIPKNGVVVNRYEVTTTVAELFIQQARKTPDLIAVVASDGVLTYGRLLDDSIRIASRLRQLGVGPDVPVGLMVERSTATLSAIWGVLLAGGAYMPLDPLLPSAYLARQLAESRISMTLASRRLSGLFPEYEGTILYVEELLENREQAQAICRASIEPDHLAYIIATSGSTGTPKTVGVLQRGISNYTLALSDCLRLREEESNGQWSFAIVSTLAADLGNTCLFPALTTGACLHLVSSDLVLDGQAFAEYMTKNRIDVLKIVPSHLRALLSYGPAVLPQRWLIVGGETFSADLFDKIKMAGARCGVINHYGPTETTVGSLLERIDEKEPMLLPPVLTVGLPIANTEAHVLDEAMRPAPANLVGNLFLGGAGLARGYLFRPDITAERFIPNPFSSQPGRRLYATGDRARPRRDGRIQILGRADGQVKIRGYRIELDEVELAIRHHPSVEAAAAMVREDDSGDKRLIAFISGKAGYPHNSAEIRQYLSSQLPSAMVPSAFIWAQALPLTPNGKLDRKKLAEMEVEPAAPSAVTERPAAALEASLANIWARVLGRRQVGLTENFFEMGGDSIAAIQIAAELRKAGIRITPLQLFQNPSICRLAAMLETSAQEPDNSTTQPPTLPLARSNAADRSSGEDGPYPLSPLQQGMLFHSMNNSAERLYVSELVCAFGEGFDPEAFAHAWRRVVERHSIFRTSFHWDEEEPQQIAHAYVPLKIDRIDWSHADPSEQETLLERYCDELRRTGIDLNVPPLMRLGLIDLGRGCYQFVWIYHHLLMDAWSEAILNDELFAYYNAFQSGEDHDRPAPPPYRAYVEWLRRQDSARAERFWRDYLRGFRKPTLVLGANNGSHLMTTPRAWEMAQLRVTAVEAAALKNLAGEKRLTLNTLVQAGWALMLGEYTGMDDVVFGVTVAGRPADLEGADLMIGPFLNTIPARVRLQRGVTAAELLGRLQSEQAEAREYEYASLLQIQSWSEAPRGAALFDSFIGFQNASLARVGNRGNGGLTPRFPIKTRSFRGGWTNYALSLDVESAEEIILTLSYDKERVTSAAARQMLACLKSALLLIADAPDAPLSSLRSSLAASRREYGARQRKDFAEAQRSQISNLRRRGRV